MFCQRLLTAHAMLADRRIRALQFWRRYDILGCRHSQRIPMVDRLLEIVQCLCEERFNISCCYSMYDSSSERLLELDMF